MVRNQVRGRQSLGPEQADLDGTVTLSLAISDTGIGIPQSHMGKLFLPFSSSTLKRYGYAPQGPRVGVPRSPILTLLSLPCSVAADWALVSRKG